MLEEGGKLRWREEKQEDIDTRHILSKVANWLDRM